MSRFQRLLDKMRGVSQLKGELLACDFGSRVTRLWVNKQGFFRQASCLAIHIPTQTVVEIGDKALNLLGKAPPHIEVVFPIKNGTVAHPEYAKLFMQSLLNKVLPAHVWPVAMRSTMTVATSAGLSHLQRETLLNTFSEAGLGTVKLKTTADALAQRLNRSKTSATALCVVDMGADKTELICFLGATPVVSTTIMIGGNHFTQILIEQIRMEYKCEVGWQAAEKIKYQIGKVTPPAPGDSPGSGSSEQKMVIRGKDVIKNIPMTVPISSQAFSSEFAKLLDELIGEIKLAFAPLPSEVIANSLENGIFLTGGGSLLSGISNYLGVQLETQTIVSPSPHEDIIRGLVPTSTAK